MPLSGTAFHRSPFLENRISFPSAEHAAAAHELTASLELPDVALEMKLYDLRGAKEASMSVCTTQITDGLITVGPGYQMLSG